MSKESDLLADALRRSGIDHVLEYRFHQVRRWRFDIAIPVIMLAIEVDGRGRHQMEKGEREGMEKQNAAIELGWRVLRYPASSIRIKKRLPLIVDQVSRICCGVPCNDSSAYVITTDPIDKQ